MRLTSTLFVSIACASIIVSAAAAEKDATPTAALKASASGNITVSSRASGKSRFVRTDGDLAPRATADSPHEKAMSFLASHGTVLGVDDPGQLSARDGQVDTLGYTTLSYDQEYNGVRVFGARINANFAPDRSLRAVNGDFATGLALDTTPKTAAAAARRAALQRIGDVRRTTELRAGQPELVIYRLPLRDNADGPAVLTWHVEVGNGNDIRDIVFVSAETGKVVDHYSAIHEAIERRVYDGGLAPAFLVWSEGDAAPFGVPSIDNLIDYTADSYHFFANLTGGSYLSWDGNDSTMFAVNNEPAIVCPNATWNGASINFCDGTSSDDVVAHEWSHGYTEATHGLIYRWQSGALNESYSDIFGETIDLLNSDGADAPSALRSVGTCTVFGGNAPPSFEVLSPAAIAGFYSASGAAFNPSSADVTGSLVLANDGSGATSDACEAVSNDLTGAIALIDRGSCPFVQKVQNAQAAGAIGAIIANNDGDSLINMGGSSAGISIPSIFVGQTDGALLRTQPAVTATFTFGGAGETSLRWLMGEDASAFGGAIRDMWAPECYGDPGRVSGGEYFCSDADQGGVHTNSGVPNHAYALLVDGGTYNGVTVDAIGMHKAAHVYWRAATHYQTPTSDFKDHADALESSCADLIGIPLPTLSTEPGGSAGTVTIDAGDCGAINAAISAVELRVPPSQCQFTTLLDPAAPALCDSGTTAQTVLLEDFESGLNGWTAGTREILNLATFSGPDWSVDSDLPDGRAGSAAYGPNLVLGNCSNDIESGIIYLESPLIALPGNIDTPRIAFHHSVMTETDYDGANLKVSVNGGAWQTVPAAAFVFNAYNGSLVASDNPMGGEPAFHGSDEGTLESGWGQSQISLAGIAAPGDTVRLRFELGMDGCNGLVGWYVDDVSLYSCEIDIVDSDNDSVPDSADNCTDVANPDQRDTNGDGIGNICDADLDDSGLVNFIDLLQFEAAFFSGPQSPNWNPDADLNGDNSVNFLDLLIVEQQFFGPPGPSGLAP